MFNQEQPRLLTFGVADEISRGGIKRGAVDPVEHPLSYAAFSCVRIDGSKLFELLEMPQYGLITSADRTTYIPRRGPFGVLPQMTEDGRSKGVDPENCDHGFHPLGERVRRSDISGHPIILSQIKRLSFHRLIQYDTLTRRG